MGKRETIGSGCVIAIGGNEQKRLANASILQAFVERAGGDRARIAIIPSASVRPEKRAALYTRIFERLGAAAVTAVHAERGVNDADRETILTASGIFVTGGDQQRLMGALRDAQYIGLIRDAVAGGAVYAGTSAGASAVSRLMIAGSIRRKGADVVEFGEGLGLVPDVIIDQHFGERNRLPRLIIAARSHGLVGVGIDENTAIVWSASRDVRVAGGGEVTIVDPEHRLEDARLRSYRIHVLRDGARFDLQRANVTTEDDIKAGA
jgi:cyanophycinase